MRRAWMRSGPYAVSTVQEEIGSRGASTATSKLSPDIGIAVDVIPATDDPGYDLPVQEYVPCKVGFGPTISTGPNTNPLVGDLLVQCAGRRRSATSRTRPGPPRRMTPA
jgi:endoglucanase